MKSEDRATSHFAGRYWRLLTLVIRVPKMYDGPFEATMLWRTFFFEAADGIQANNAAWFENANGQWAMTETNIDFCGTSAGCPGRFRCQQIYLKPKDGPVLVRWMLERKEVVGAGGSEGVTVVYVIGVTRTADGITTGMDLYFRSTEGVL